MTYLAVGSLGGEIFKATSSNAWSSL